MFPRLLTAAFLAGAISGVALAQGTPVNEPTPEAVVTDLDSGQAVVVFDPELSKEFAIKREVVDEVAAKFGKSAVFDNGHQLPKGLDMAIAPGNTLPDSAEVRDVPAELSDLPVSGEGLHWVAVGEHLVEVTPDNRIVLVVYDALP